MIDRRSRLHMHGVAERKALTAKRLHCVVDSAMRTKEVEKRRKVRKERRREEESLYFILERDLDRDAIFPEHDG